MAKTWKDGVLILDAADQGIDTRTRVYSITVHASADTWAVDLSDRDATLKWSFANNVANNRGDHFVFPEGIEFNGIVLTTATDLTRVILTTKPVQA